LNVPEQSVGIYCLHCVERSNKTAIGLPLLKYVYGVVLWIGKGEIEGTRGLGGEEIPNWGCI